MRPDRTHEENMEVLRKVLNERARIVLSQKNIEFTLTHQTDTLDELAIYLRRCKAALGHVPARTEIIGGEYLELRFGSWANALQYSGFTNCTRAVVNTPAPEHTALFREEYDRQWELHKQAKRERKKNAEIERRERKSAKRQARKASNAGGAK